MPLLCAREMPVPGALPRVIRVLIHCYGADEHEPQHVYLGEAPRCGSTSRARSSLIAMPLEFGEKVRRIPVYPVADGYASEGPVAKLASNESAVPADPRGGRGGHAASSAASTATRTRRTPRCARGCRTATACRPTGSRSATARATSCSPPATRCSSPGAEVVYAWPSFSVYPHLAAASGARAIEVPLDADHKHDLAKMREEITVATRLVLVCNPNNPTSTALPLEDIAAFVADVPRHVAVILDEAYCEFNILAGPRRVDPLLKRHPNLVLLRTFSKVYGLCGLRVGFALCGSEDFRTAVDQVRQPFFCNAAAQAAALEALNHQDEVARRVERNLAERIGLEDGLRRLGLGRPSRRPTSSGSTSRGARTTTPPRSSARSSRASPSAASSSARAARSAAPARSASPSAPRPRTSASWRRLPHCSSRC